MRLIVLCLVLAAAISVPAHASSQTAPSAAYDLRGFAAELRRIAAALDNASEGEAMLVRQQLPPRWFVESQSERHEVRTDWLLEALPATPGEVQSWAAKRTRIRERLLTLSAEASSLADAVPDGREIAARRSLEEILKRREFEQGAAAAWMRRLEQWLRDLFTRLVESLGLTPQAGRLTAVTLAWVAGLAALIGLGFWLARALAQQSRSVRLALNTAAGRQLSAREWADRWSVALQAGDAREAIRCAYHACLRRLEEQGVWRTDPARTAREYLRLLPARHDRREAVTDLTRQFERVWYGDQPLTPDAARQVTAHLESLGCLAARHSAI